MMLQPLAPAVGRGHPLLALLVDRDADTRRMYAEFLRLSACEIEEAEDGREALAKALARHPDIIITETRLPGMNGYDLCNLLRSDEATRNVPVVFVTGDAFASEIERAQLSGADAVLIKPCLPETLVTAISKLLQQSADLRARSRATSIKSQDQLALSERLLRRSRAARHEHRRLCLSRAHVREQTTEPPTPPPALVCPVCDHPLQYERSNIGGVSALHAEQWDYYDCPAGCGTFQYRQRTRKLRRVM